MNFVVRPHFYRENVLKQVIIFSANQNRSNHFYSRAAASLIEVWVLQVPTFAFQPGHLHLICFNWVNFRDLSNILTYSDNFATFSILSEITEISECFKFWLLFKCSWLYFFIDVIMRLVVVKRGFTCYHEILAISTHSQTRL